MPGALGGASSDPWLGYPYKTIVEDGYKYAHFYGEPQYVKYQWDNSSGQAGLEVSTVAPAPLIYRATITVQTSAPVAKGDTIGLELQVKVIKSNETFGAGAQVIMEQANTYAGYQATDIPMVNTTWTPVRFAISAETECSESTPC